MAQELINIGTTPNDGTGDSLRTAFTKINNNFTQIFQTASDVSNVFTVGTTADQILFQTTANNFTTGTFQVYSYETTLANSQSVSISAAITNNGNVRFTAWGTTFDGGPVTTYSMDVVSGNVILYATPLSTDVVRHMVISTVSFIGNVAAGLDLSTETGDLLTTETGLILST